MAKEAWELAKRQHWAITRQQLLEIGYTSEAIDVRLEDGRLFPAFAGVYAVGRPHLERHGVLMAAVLACGDGAALSHDSAAELYETRRRQRGPIHVSVPYARNPRIPGIKVHRRKAFETHSHDGIPVTTAICTLIDLGATLTEPRLERAINETVNRDLLDLDELRAAAAEARRRLGARRVLALLDRDTFVVTDTRLEQRFARIARRAGLPRPETQARLRAGRVDFYWPQLKLVVEADSLRFHRTPAQQRIDVERDQQHHAAKLRPLRFTHWQIFHEPDHVEAILAAVVS
jgi:very-short-patch-repair endonuclease